MTSPTLDTPTKDTPRPDGELVWFHGTTEERLWGLCDMGNRLRMLRPDLRVLTTWEKGTAPSSGPKDCDLVGGAIELESPSEIRGFLDRWRPDACVWAGGKLRRLLMRKLRDRHVPMLLADIEANELPTRATRWLPDQRHRLLNGFRRILAPDQPVADKLLHMGAATEKVRTCGRLRASVTPPDCHEDDLQTLQASCSSRPIWLAAKLPLDDLDTVVQAHRNTLRLLHRLLLIVSLEDPRDLPRARERLRATGLGLADWEQGEDPEEHHQLLLCGPEDLGLWYRLAPLSLIGGTLERGAPGNTPLDAAALGSAVLYGPGILQYRGVFDRLEAAGAARRVFAAGDLGDAVFQLSAPDAAAEMALAGWQMVTDGAMLTDALMQELQAILDEQDTKEDQKTDART